MRRFCFSLVALTLAGCASHGVVQNVPQTGVAVEGSYSLETFSKRSEGDLSLNLTFSGGGARAAALAYGVLLELRETKYVAEGRSRRLLDEVDVISSVSGGSFTAAYYGLYGEEIFESFEEKFLHRDIEGVLVKNLLSPARWFSRRGRTEMATDYYREMVFGDATFADLKKSNGPLILINASDLSSGARFSFVQEYFNLLCSDLDSFPVAKAVAASSAVPVLFSPVVVENFQGCDTGRFKEALERSKASQTGPEILLAASALEKLVNEKEKYRYLHLVDGGITDNLGLRSFYEVIELSGGIETFFRWMGKSPSKRGAMIVVNASTDPGYGVAASKDEPTIEQTLGAVSDIQLHRYNASTVDLMRQNAQKWRDTMKGAGPRAEHHFIEVNLRNVMPAQRRKYFNLIPTSLTLTEEQVDELIGAGRQLLRENPDFQALVKGLTRE